MSAESKTFWKGFQTLLLTPAHNPKMKGRERSQPDGSAGRACATKPDELSSISKTRVAGEK